jgi:DNA-binding CsgD family transcriptional regulator
LVAAYKAGDSIAELAARFSINRSTVFKHLQTADVARRYPALDSNQCDEVCRLYAKGLNSTEIGKTFAVSADTILRALKRGGIKIRDTKY